MAEKDYYKILGVSGTAGMDEIKKAYRQLAMKYHPDRNPENKDAAERRFKDISEAFYVLGDEKRRAEYDAFKKGYGYGAESGQFTGAEGFDFEEILKHFGGFGRRGRGASYGATGFEDIFSIFSNMGSDGTQTEYIYTQRPEGAVRGARYGRPKESTDARATLEIPANLAQRGGEALFNYNGKKITLKIKPNTSSGQQLRMKGQGETCPYCNHPGDLIITIKVRA
jgi:curved DNA-binding protein